MLENNFESTIRAYLLDEDDNFEFFEYENFYDYFYKFVQSEYVNNNADGSKKKVFLSSSSNHAIHSWVPTEFIHKDMSLIAKYKIIKNASEIEAAKLIHKTDSARVVEFFYKIDKQFEPGNNISYFGLKELNEFNLGYN